MDKKTTGLLFAAAAVVLLIFLFVAGLGGERGPRPDNDHRPPELEVVPASSQEDGEAVQTKPAEKPDKKKTTAAADGEDEAVQTAAKNSGKKSKTTAAETEPAETTAAADDTYVEYKFRNNKLLNQHFEKHGGEFDYATAAEYEKGASDVINDPDALYKVEAEDGDGVYYIEATNEFVILSADGYIRTYFKPSGGIDYFNRQ